MKQQLIRLERVAGAMTACSTLDEFASALA